MDTRGSERLTKVKATSTPIICGQTCGQICRTAVATEKQLWFDNARGRIVWPMGRTAPHLQVTSPTLSSLTGLCPLEAKQRVQPREEVHHARRPPKGTSTVDVRNKQMGKLGRLAGKYPE